MASLLLNNNMLLINMFTIIHVVSEGEGKHLIKGQQQVYCKETMG